MTLKKSKKGKAEKSNTEIIQERIKKIVFKNSSSRKIEVNVIRDITCFEWFAKKKFISSDEKNSIGERLYDRLKKRLDKHFKAGAITSYKYYELSRKIKRVYDPKNKR